MRRFIMAMSAGNQRMMMNSLQFRVFSYRR